MSNRINIIVPGIIMVVVLYVRWHVVAEYSIDPFEDGGLCTAAVLSLYMSLYKLIKGQQEMSVFEYGTED